MAWLRTIAGTRFAGPTLLALVLGLVTLPIVAVLGPTLVPGAPIASSSSAPYAPPLDPARWWSAVGSVMGAALVAGTVGGWVARRNLFAGAATAVVCAWIIGIAMIPVVPVLLGIPFEAVPFCIDSCGAAIDGELGAGLVAFASLGFVFAFAVAWPQFLILVAGVYFWSITLRPILPARSPVDGAGPPLSPAP